MTDESPAQPQQSAFSMAMEMAAVHAVGTAIIRWFFRSQGHDGIFWEAGDESLIANGLNGAFDILYWTFVHPAIVKFRK